MAAFTPFPEISGREPQMGESAIDRAITVLCVTAPFHETGNNRTLSLTRARDKAVRLATTILAVNAAGGIPHAKLWSLIGRLGFAQTAAIGRFAREVSQPHYVRL